MLAGRVVLALIASAPAGSEPAPRFDHIRTSEPVFVSLLERGYRDSATFRLLVDRVERSNLHVYVGFRRDGGPTGLHHLVTANGIRYAWIAIVRDRGAEQLTARLAHELQHASEIAGAPEIVDDETVAAYYRLHGFSQGGGAIAETFESAEAQRVERAVFRELVQRR